MPDPTTSWPSDPDDEADFELIGMAARLSADLGLHLDVTQHMQNGILTERDLEIRRITFWGVFIHEQ
jgi:hypothetical protein